MVICLIQWVYLHYLLYQWKIMIYEPFKSTEVLLICTKVFEYIIPELHGDLLTSSELRFAYKSKVFSTQSWQCTWMGREIISYCTNNGLDVYASLLDCSKAFDNVRHDTLPQKLVSTGLTPAIIRSLMYTDNKIQVKWKDTVSVPVDATNGGKTKVCLITDFMYAF